MAATPCERGNALQTVAETGYTPLDTHVFVNKGMVAGHTVHENPFKHATPASRRSRLSKQTSFRNTVATATRME